MTTILFLKLQNYELHVQVHIIYPSLVSLKYFILVQGVFKEHLILIPIGCAPFCQYQELRRLGWSNFLSMHAQRVHLFSQPIRFVRLTMGMRVAVL